MIGPILLVVSWLLLRFEGRSISAIGVDKPSRRLAEFGAGFAILGIAAAVQQLGLSLATDDPFVRNANWTPAMLLEHARFIVNSVLYEELLFRGYLLYQAIRWLGVKRAVWLDAVVFGMYHWFSYGAFGNPVMMVYLLIMTGTMGLAWARAFVATGSVAAPIGLHLGWNAISYIVFSAGPLDAALLVPASGAKKLQASGLPSVLLSIVLPLAACAFVLWLCRRYEHRRDARHPDDVRRQVAV